MSDYLSLSEFGLSEHPNCEYGSTMADFNFITRHAESVFSDTGNDDDNTEECSWTITEGSFELKVCCFEDGGHEHTICTFSGNVEDAAAWLESNYPEEWAKELKYIEDEYAEYLSEDEDD